jgi:hypothetical protein
LSFQLYRTRDGSGLADLLPEHLAEKIQRARVL